MDTQHFTCLFGAPVLAMAMVAVFRAMFFTVQQRTTAIVQRLGKFTRQAAPGIHVKIPFIDSVVGPVNLCVQQLNVEIETKTEDNAFVRMVVAVQHYVLPEKVYDAFYKLDNPSRQITSFVFDVLRAQVPKSARRFRITSLLPCCCSTSRGALLADEDAYHASGATHFLAHRGHRRPRKDVTPAVEPVATNSGGLIMTALINYISDLGMARTVLGACIVCALAVLVLCLVH